MARVTTFSFIERAQGRASLYESNDIGPVCSGRWQPAQFLNRIGATSLVKVTLFFPSNALVEVRKQNTETTQTTAKPGTGLLMKAPFNAGED
jgi:hypothetical protein